MYKKGDFHIHSSGSDGELKPGEIVLLAKDRKIDIISITDHNTISGVKQAVNTGNIYGIKVIPGIELSTRYKGNRIHILGYFYNEIYENERFIKTLELIRKGKFKKCQIDYDGIEAKYYRNKENETEYFIEMARKKGIIYTAGSDFHSLKKVDLKHGTLGQIYLESDEIERFITSLNKYKN